MTTSKASSTDAPADRVLVLTREFDAPRHLIFEAWTKKEHLDAWSCPKGFRIERSHGDLRVGGAWGCQMIAPDGEKHEMTGVYQEIVPNELLVMSHGWLEDDGSRPWETTLTLRFADAGGGKTKLTLEQAVFKSVESRDGHNGGWSQALDKLGEFLAELKTKEKS
jgi:uncharacterized protein YndB with AHSA1/START domain